MRLTVAEDKFTKILVIGDQNPSLSRCMRQDVRIVGLGHLFCNGKYVMANTAQIFSDCCTGRLVYEQAHLTVSYAGVANGKTSSWANT